MDIYGATKACQEIVAEMFHYQYGLDIAALRIGYVVDCNSLIDKYGTHLERVEGGMIDPTDCGTAISRIFALPELGYRAWYLYSACDKNTPEGLPARRELNWPPKYMEKTHPHHSRIMRYNYMQGLVAGHEDLNDHHELRTDPLIQTVVGRDCQLATPSTLCRFENGIDRRACVDLSRLFVEFFIESFSTPPRELILDFDATDDLTYGMQENRFFHGYYDHYCFLPLYVFCGDQLLVAYLRPSKIDAAKHAWAILSLLVKRFRQK